MLPEAINFLIKAGHHAPSADNSQPWKFHWDNGALSLCYDEKRGAFGLSAQHPATLLTIGAVIENVMQASRAIEVPVSLGIPKDFNKDGCYFRQQVDPKSHVPNDALNHILFSRHTNRFPYKKKPLPNELSIQLESTTEAGAEIKVLSGIDEIAQIADLTRFASRVRFQTPELHEWFINSIRFTAAEVDQGDGLDLATLALPPGGRYILRVISDWRRMALLNELGAYKLFASIEAQSIKHSGGIIAIVGDNSDIGAIHAGKIMERTWILLNSKGVAVQPYFVVPDQIFGLTRGSIPANLIEQVKSLAARTLDYFSVGDKMLYMLLRIGYSSRTVVRSKRLPLQQIYQISEP